MNHEEIPGYTRACARGQRLETAWREFAFLGVCDLICSVAVKPITLRMFLQLEHARSPFIVGGRIRPQDVGVFLWRLSPEFVPDQTARNAFAAKHVRLPFRPAVRAINRFLDRMLIDRPPSRPAGSRSFSDVSFAGDLVHTFATEYGWGQEQTLDMAMPAVFQCLRCIHRGRKEAVGKTLPLLNPLQTRLTKRFRKKAREAKKAADAAAGAAA